MRGILVVLALLLLCQSVFAAVDGDIYDRDHLILDTTLNASIDVQRTTADNLLESIKTRLYFQPVEDPRLEVLTLTTTPEAERDEGSLLFTWLGNDTSHADYAVRSTIKTKTVYDLLPNKVGFPLDPSKIPEDIRPYLEETTSVDFHDPEIRRKASELVEGEDDLYVAVNKIGIWIQQDVQYNLSTVTADASQKASWVMKNRYGVCDEITNLFLAMTRSVGVPARFVSGIAYTNSPLFEDKWGAHGWAEVWFPDYGWVPFDLTYRQYGWLDPSHVKLRESLDATDPSTRFEWRGRGVDLKVSPLMMDAEIKEKGPRVDYQLEIIPTVQKDSVGLGSYDLVTADVINYNNYYKTTDISLARTDGLRIEGNPDKMVILKPYERAQVAWLVQVDDQLDKDFEYTFPLLAYNQRNITGKTEFAAKVGEPIFDRQEMRDLQKNLLPQENKSVLRDLLLSCEDDQVLGAESVMINCSVHNAGNEPLAAVEICAQEECGTVDLLIGETKEVPLLVTGLDPGRNERLVVATADQTKATTTAQITMLDTVRLDIINITAPAVVHYDDDVAIAFSLKKASVAEPIDVRVKVDGGVRKTFTLDKLEGRQDFVINTKGAYLSPGENEVTIEALYHDAKYERFTATESLKITLSDLSTWQMVKAYANRFGLWLQYFIGLHEALLEEE